MILGKQEYNACVTQLQPYQTFHTRPFTQHLIMIINPRDGPVTKALQGELGHSGAPDVKMEETQGERSYFIFIWMR